MAPTLIRTFPVEGKPVRVISADGWRQDEEYADDATIEEVLRVTWGDYPDLEMGWVADVVLYEDGWAATEGPERYASVEEAATAAVLQWVAYEKTLTPADYRRLFDKYTATLKSNPGPARVVPQRHRKSGKKRYVVKVGDRQIGDHYAHKFEADEARDRYNARMEHARTKAQIEKDRAAIVKALGDGGMDFQALMLALGFPEASLRESEDDGRVQSDLKALRKGGTVAASARTRFRPQDSRTGTAHFGGAGVRKERYNVYSLGREKNPSNNTDLVRKLKF